MEHPGLENAARGNTATAHLVRRFRGGTRFRPYRPEDDAPQRSLLPPEGRCESILLAVEDITDRKRTERALKEAERQKDEINAQLAIAHDRMSRDLKAAARIQETFLPRELPRVPGAAFAWIYRPCDELAGDGLNVIPLGGGRVAPLHPRRERPRCRGGPADSGAEPSPVRPVESVLDPDPGWRRPGSARNHSARRGCRPPEPALPLRHNDRAVRDDDLRRARRRRPGSFATSPRVTPARCISPPGRGR